MDIGLGKENQIRHGLVLSVALIFYIEPNQSGRAVLEGGRLEAVILGRNMVGNPPNGFARAEGSGCHSARRTIIIFSIVRQEALAEAGSKQDKEERKCQQPSE